MSLTFMIAQLISLLVLILIFGVAWWGIVQLPIDPKILAFAQVVVVCIFVLLLLGIFIGGFTLPVRLGTSS
jgi:uncharacterized membrane protein YwzB